MLKNLTIVKNILTFQKIFVRFVLFTRFTFYDCTIHVCVSCVRSAEGIEPEQADHVDTVFDRRGVCAQLVTVDAVHIACRVPAASDRVDGHAVQGVRVRPHDGHVHHVHQSAALRLAEHQFPAGHLRHMPADVVLRRSEAAAEAQAVPVGGDGLSRAQRPPARARVRGTV